MDDEDYLRRLMEILEPMDLDQIRKLREDLPAIIEKVKAPRRKARARKMARLNLRVLRGGRNSL